MNPRRKQRLLLVSLLVLGLGGAVGLVLFALQQNIDLFYTPGELVRGKGPELVRPVAGQRLRIGGMVLPGSVHRDPQSLKVSFELIDATGERVWVHYEGILPDLFREGQGIVAQGVLKDARSIEASEVLAKHDENYLPPDVAGALKGMNHLKTQAGQPRLTVGEGGS